MEKGKDYREGRVGGLATVVLEGETGWALTEDYLRVEVAADQIGSTWDKRSVLSGRLQGSGEHLYIDLSQTLLN